jgi:hypothetical protein
MNSYWFLFFLISNLLLLTIGFGQHTSYLNMQVPGPSKKNLAIVTEELNDVEGRLPAIRKLYSEGIISKRDMEAFEEKYKDLQQAKQTLKNEVTRTALRKEGGYKKKSSSLKNWKKPKIVARSKRSYSSKGVVLKSSGSMIQNDMLQDLREHYYATYSESLPISAHGQSSTHNRFGWDHSGRVDVSVHPDSDRGQTVMNFLRARNIAFLAFRASVPGQSTGPHIHIGPPSARLP